MIRFAHLACESKDSIIPYIKSQLLGQHLSLNYINQLQIENQEGFIISTFVSEVTPQDDSAVGGEFHCRFSEKKMQFTVIFQNRLAEEMKNLMLHERISVGNFVSLYGAKGFANKGKASTNVKVTFLTMDGAENQQVIIWKNSSLHYVEPFHTHINRYKHIEFYNMDHTGSKGHVLSNLRSLTVTYGSVKELKLMAGTNHRCVALATFTNIMYSSLREQGKTKRKTDQVQVKFCEIKFECNVLNSNNFSAFFIGELASEIDRAENERHIEYGDFVALICPHFRQKTAAPININFPKGKRINLVVLKNQYINREVGSTIRLSDINPPYRSIQLCTRSSKDYFPLEFFSKANGSNAKLLISKICKRLEKLGTISTTANIIGLSEKKRKNKIILSYFLKLMRGPETTLTETVGAGKTIVFLQEISPDYNYGFYIKLVLHSKFNDTFYSAVKSKAIVRGDVICLQNPVIFERNQSEYESDLSYVVDIGNPEKQAIFVFRIRKNDEFEKSKEAEVQICKDNMGSVKKKKYSSDECIKKINTSTQSLTDLLVPNNAGEQSETNMSSKRIQNHEVYKPKITKSYKRKIQSTPKKSLYGLEEDQVQEVESPMLLVTSNNVADKECRMKSDFMSFHDKVIPIKLIKPALNHSMDLISGYCIYGCNLMFPYSSVNTTLEDKLNLLCPQCSKVLVLNFCLEMVAIASDGLSKVLLYGAEAEKFLNITITEFLTYDDTFRELVVKLLKQKLHLNQTMEGLPIQVKDVTFMVKECGK